MKLPPPPPPNVINLRNKGLILNTLDRFSRIMLVCLIMALSVPSHEAHAVGFRWIEKYDLRIAVWYPSPAPETDVRLGPFDARLAVDAAPEATGIFQPVLFSHGNLGRARNHHLTAKALAESGLIVIAPLHSADHLLAGNDIPKVMDWRVVELRNALEAVMQNEAFRSILDLSRIHALGYSLGALTVLNAAGASIDVPSADEHCEIEVDPAFCDTPSRFLRWRINRMRDTTTPTFNREVDGVHFPLGFVNGAIAVVAPVGQGVGIDASTFLGRSILVIGLEDDKVTQPAFHASNLARMFADAVETELLVVPGHHSAFIAPFAKRVTDVENIPAAMDPEGFNRLNFLVEVNEILTDFFSEAKNN